MAIHEWVQMPEPVFCCDRTFQPVPMDKPKSEPMVSTPILEAERIECKVEVLTAQSYIQLHHVITLTK
jgi:hypothetical protein